MSELIQNLRNRFTEVNSNIKKKSVIILTAVFTAIGGGNKRYSFILNELFKILTDNKGHIADHAYIPFIVPQPLVWTVFMPILERRTWRKTLLIASPMLWPSLRTLMQSLWFSIIYILICIYLTLNEWTRWYPRISASRRLWNRFFPLCYNRYWTVFKPLVRMPKRYVAIVNHHCLGGYRVLFLFWFLRSFQIHWSHERCGQRAIKKFAQIHWETLCFFCSGGYSFVGRVSLCLHESQDGPHQECFSSSTQLCDNEEYSRHGEQLQDLLRLPSNPLFCDQWCIYFLCKDEH